MFCAMNAMEDSSPCNSTPMNLLSVRDRLRLEWEERVTARLQQCRRQREQEQRRSERTEVRQARLNRQRVHGEESSVVLNRSIGVERDPSCQLALNINKLKLHVNLPWTLTSWCYITHQWHLYQLAQACPHNVLHFLVMLSWLATILLAMYLL